MRRTTAGAIAAFLVTSSAFLFGAPAQGAPEAEGKTKVEISSGTVAVGADRKELTFTLTNLGDQPLQRPRLVFDRDSWDTDQVALEFNSQCETGATTVECELFSASLPPGQLTKLVVGLEVGAEATPGPAGTVVVHSRHEGGDDETFEFPLTVSGAQGPDLFIRASEVPGNGTVEPGAGAQAWYVFGNHGDVPVKNVQVEITLPEGAKVDSNAIGENPPLFNYCFTRADNQVGICEFPNNVFEPHSGAMAYFPIVVNEDAKHGVDLTGSMTVTGEIATEAELAAAQRARKSSLEAVPEIDDADNTDEFQILVAPEKPATTPPGGSGGGSGGDDPSLPVTGPVAASAAGVGVGFLALGALLVFAARRRRAEGVH